MIPKVIHCCWLSGEPKPPLVERCIESWRQFAPDWKVREWTLDEIRRAAAADELASPPLFFEEAVKTRKWAFAADWLRFAALLAEGGLYLDCDVELVKPLDVTGEFGAGQWMPGDCIGLEPAAIALEKCSVIAREMVGFYADAQFDTLHTTGEIMAEVIRRKGLSLEVLPPEVFCPIGVDGVVHATERTVGIHRYAMSWASPQRKIARWLSWHGMRGVVDWALKVRKSWRGG